MIACYEVTAAAAQWKMGFSLKNFDVNGACDEELRKASGEDENVMRQKLAISF
ncbi:hypothetical protein WN943_012696 [Citrus x changshan-huyou]